MTVNCYADPFPTFQPAMRLAIGITNANPGVVTTSFAHQYNSGLIVRLDIPPSCGMQQISGQTAAITVTSPTSFSIGIDTTTHSPFVYPPVPVYPNLQGCAMVVPVGEINSSLASAQINALPYSAT